MKILYSLSINSEKAAYKKNKQKTQSQALLMQKQEAGHTSLGCRVLLKKGACNQSYSLKSHDTIFSSDSKAF